MFFLWIRKRYWKHPNRLTDQVAVPAREDWDRVHELLNQNTRTRPAPDNKTKHRYAGLLACAECGNPFVPMIRYWNGSRRVEYVCKGYHRNGKTYCSSHRIHEETLDARVWELVPHGS